MNKLDNLGYFTNALLVCIILGISFIYRDKVPFDTLLMISFPGFYSLYKIIDSLATKEEKA